MITFKEFREKYEDTYDIEDMDVLSIVLYEDILRVAFDIFAHWAVECGFGYDDIPEETDKYEDELDDYNYVEGLKKIAIWEAMERLYGAE